MGIALDYVTLAGRKIHVEGYTRRDGTRVMAYERGMNLPLEDVAASVLKVGDIVVHAGRAKVIEHSETVLGQTLLTLRDTDRHRSTLRVKASEIFKRVVLAIIAAAVIAGTLGAVAADWIHSGPDEPSITATKPADHRKGERELMGEGHSPHVHEEHDFAHLGVQYGTFGIGENEKFRFTTKSGRKVEVTVDGALRTVEKIMAAHAAKEAKANRSGVRLSKEWDHG